MDAYLAYQKPRKEPASYAALEQSAKRVKDKLGDHHAERLTRPIMEHCIQEMRETPIDANRRAYEEGEEKYLSNATIRRSMGIFKAACNHGLKEKWLDSIPPIPLPPSSPPLERWLTKKQAKKLLSACQQTPHLKLFVLIALATGARKGAILGLTWQQVDMDTRLIHFNPPERHQTKKRRAVTPINNMLYSALSDAQEAALTDYVIEFNGKQVDSVRNAFSKAAARAGLRGVTPHTLRHTAATWMAQSGVDMQKIAEMLGHSDMRMTYRTYSKWSPDFLKEAARATEF